MSAGGADPLAAEQIDALFAPLLGTETVLIAASGGPDSTALLVMAAGWAARRGARVVAATVDHRLRPESAAEAETVAALSAELGVPHTTLLWTGAKPTTRVQERAREARYRLLIEHARAIGADAIATAHHADDQAETVLFRLVRGSGIAGLSGMEAISRRDGVTIARPLLGVAKRDLVAFCGSRGIEFVDDPSNANPRFARPRLRALLDRLGEEGLNAEGLVRLGAAPRGDERRRMTADVEARLGADGPIDARDLCSPSRSRSSRRMLARRIGKAGGRDESRIGLEKIEALALRLRDALGNEHAFSANVGGAFVRLSAKGCLSLACRRGRAKAAANSEQRRVRGLAMAQPLCQFSRFARRRRPDYRMILLGRRRSAAADRSFFRPAENGLRPFLYQGASLSPARMQRRSARSIARAESRA